MGFTRWKSWQASSHRRVSRLDSSVLSSRSPGAALRSMFTLPTRPRRPLCSVSSISAQAASLWMVAKAENRMVPAAHSRLRKTFQARRAKSRSRNLASRGKV